jgi:hypothetical protein
MFEAAALNSTTETQRHRGNMPRSKSLGTEKTLLFSVPSLCLCASVVDFRLSPSASDV